MTYRGPNVSQYLANLNAINPTQSSPEAFEDSYADDDLALFASAQFFNFEMGDLVGDEGEKTTEEKEVVKGESSLGFLDGLQDFGAFDYPDLLPVLPDDVFVPNIDLTTTPQPQQQSQLPPTSTQRETFVQPQPIQPQAILPHPSSTAPSPITQTLTSTLPPYLKRKASAIDLSESTSVSPSSPFGDDSSRNAADEDKRRRNTAASARFRIKKKQREQALEGHAKELESKCQALQEKVNQLEMENKWLKNLITDKSGDDKTQQQGSASSSSLNAGKKGVGPHAA